MYNLATAGPGVTGRPQRVAGLGRAAWAELDLDRSSPVPLYHQIAQQLKQHIEAGRLEPRTMLGNEIELAGLLAVSRPTLRKAIERLVEEGLLARRRGFGTVVVPNRVKRRLSVPSLYDDLKSSGRSPSTSVLVLAQRPAPENVARALDLPAGAPTVFIRRVRHADGAPLALMQNYLPVGLIAPSSADLENRGLFELLRSSGIEPHAVNEMIGARLSTRAESQRLEMKAGAPVLTLSVVTYDKIGRIIDFGQHAYRADRYSFETSHVIA
jgi:DNA-binding GntR family transcriptional regulator